jgi:hypothetical protein
MKYLLLLLCLFFIHPGLCQDDELIIEKQIHAASFQEAIPMKIDMKTLMDPKMMEMLKHFIKESKVQELSPEVMKKMIMEKVKDKPMEKIFLRFPRLLNIAAAVMIDKEALPALLGILPRQDDLKFFALCSLGLFIFAFFAKRFFVTKKASFFKRLWITIGVNTMVSTVSLGFFFYLFHAQLWPTLKVIAGEF